MKDVIQWDAKEVNGDYPKTWGAKNLTVEFNEYEELIVEKARLKVLDRIKKEKYNPRELVAKNWYTNEVVDHIPTCLSVTQNHIGRMLDGYGTTPPVISQKDVVNYPQLMWLAEVMWYARFHVDSLYSAPVTFGEDLLSKKFRFVEHGPPLQVEPFAKTKEDLQFYLDNIPDPAKQGLFPVNMWVTKMRIKHLGDQYPVWGSCCPGQISSAGFLLGIKEFLIAVRQDQELARLAFQCATAVLHRRIDVMLPILGEQLDENGNGNLVWWCDGAGGYMTVDEFTKNFDDHYGASIRYATDKGWKPYTALGGPKGTLEAVGSCMQENGGGGVMFAEAAGAIEQGFDTLNKFSDVVLMTYPATRTVLNGSEEDIRKELMRIVNSAKATTKGQRVSIHNNYDVQTPIEKIDLTLRLEKEMFKLPLGA